VDHQSHPLQMKMVMQEWGPFSACNALGLSTVLLATPLWGAWCAEGERGQVGEQEEQEQGDWELKRQKERKRLVQSGRMSVMQGCPGKQRAVQKTQTHLPHELASVKEYSHQEGHPRCLEEA
jgi:hypothetical protein